MRTSSCKGCGKEIVWAFITKNGTRTGKKIPLDPRPLIYRVGAFDQFEYEATPISQAEGMVGHFSTCPKANEF